MQNIVCLSCYEIGFFFLSEIEIKRPFFSNQKYLINASTILKFSKTLLERIRKTGKYLQAINRLSLLKMNLTILIYFSFQALYFTTELKETLSRTRNFSRWVSVIKIRMKFEIKRNSIKNFKYKRKSALVFKSGRKVKLQIHLC